MKYLLSELLPNGKLLYYNDTLYQYNLLKLLNENDYNNLINDINNNVNTSIVVGTYSGNDTKSQNINLGFRPKAVLVMARFGDVLSYKSTVGLALDNFPVQYADSDGIVITDIGFTAFNGNFGSTANVVFNESESTYNPYRYIALKTIT